MTEERLDPDTILENLKRKESQSKKGKLRIFLGMSPGVGKTFAMLTNAKERIKEGVDVKIAVVETHGRKETLALLDDLSVIHKTKIQYKGIEIEEMDLDSILTLKPQLVIIDELAHSNAPNSRHPKRYQDVIEIINSGINVYTTLNVQHIESRAEAVYQITGIRIQETVPDSILDMAEEITLIDLSPEELRQRLEEGKVYLGDRAVTAANNFFRTGNLTALREIALRITAEHVNKDLRNLMSDKRISGPWKTSERIMVAVAGTPFSESLIRWTRKSADSLGAPWTAVYIDTHQHLSNEEQNRLNNNLALSRQLGAEVIIRSGIDVAEMLLKVARENNITQICIGKPAKLNYLINRKSFIHRLIEESGDIDIHMIRVSGQSYESKKQLKESKPKNISQYLYASAVVTLVTLVSFIVEEFAGYSAISIIYLLSVVISGIFLQRGPVLLIASLSALLWNLLFIPPKFTFRITSSYDIMMFLMYFIVAIAMGQITSRLKERENAISKQEKSLFSLYQLTKIVALSLDKEEGINNALTKLEEVINTRATLFLTNDKGLPDFSKCFGCLQSLNEKEQSVAIWSSQHKLAAGKYTETLPDSENYYFPLISLGSTVAVLAISGNSNKYLTSEQRSLLESFASLATVIIEKDLFVKMTQEAKIKIESEKLQAALLDSVSHELKTPLTIIAGTAEVLDKSNISSEDFHNLIKEIRTASKRLLKTVNSLLEMSRLESGQLKLNLSWQDIRDIINSVVEDLSKEKLDVHLSLEYEGELPLIKIDSVIIQQILSNLISNAITHSPKDGVIEVKTKIISGLLQVKVIDQGPGILPEEQSFIFDRFFRGKNSKPGGLGLGLSISKQLTQIHGGDLKYVSENSRGYFSLTLEVEILNDSQIHG